MTQCFENHNPITIRYLTNQIDYSFRIAISTNIMSRILRRMPRVKMVRGVPMDKLWVFPNTQEIDAFYEEMDQVLLHVPRQFVINVDETKCVDFVDARNEYVIVPATYPDDTIPVPDRCDVRLTFRELLPPLFRHLYDVPIKSGLEEEIHRQALQFQASTETPTALGVVSQSRNPRWRDEPAEFLDIPHSRQMRQDGSSWRKA
jgi:hypothetical protein